MEQNENNERLMTPSNVITIVRILLVPVFVVALLSPWPEWLGFNEVTFEVKSVIAAAIFVLISGTDWIDGYLARKRNEVTDFGKFMDPLADKILVCAALLALVELQVLPSWPVLIILIREFIVAGIRMLAATRGVVIAASWYGKAKTVTQIIAIVLFLVKDFLALPYGNVQPVNLLYILSWVVMIVALVLTVLSMLDYLSKARHLLGFSLNKPGEVQERENPEQPNASLATLVIQAAESRRLSLATAESLTGGLIAGALTEVPGSSAVVHGGIVSYINEVKHQQLGVSQQVLDTVGAVSEETAREMAEGARKRLNADIAVSVTGIAGPTGAEPGKPVGTVWMGISTKVDTQAKVHHFSGDREDVRTQTVDAALQTLLETIEGA